MVSVAGTIKSYFKWVLIVYLLLYMFPFPLDMIPVAGEAAGAYSMGLEKVVYWFGKKILNISSIEIIEMTGSGDTTLEYVKTVFYVVIALLASVILQVATKPHQRKQLHLFTVTYARYYLGIFMLSYGLAKVFEGQFQYPSLFRLEQTFGSSSPMGLLWTFMGFSKTYSAFTGISEVVGGILLLFRRTTILGALVTAAVMINVVMLIFSYDVPVKLFSSHLFLLAVFITAGNWDELFTFFFRKEAVSLWMEPFVLNYRWYKWFRRTMKFLLIILIPGLIIYQEFQYMSEEPVSKKFTAVYKPQTFIVGDDTLLPAPADAIRWRSMVIDREYAKITDMRDSVEYYEISEDSVKRQLIFTSTTDSTTSYRLSYNTPSEKTFVLKGSFGSQQIEAIFDRKKVEDYELVARGFHWISEYPYNR